MRIVRHAWQRATVAALSLRGVVALSIGIGLVSAFFVLPAKNTLGERAITGVEVAAIALAILVAVPFLWHLARYLRTGGRNEWESELSSASNGIKITLSRHPDAMPESFGAHGVMACEVQCPDGTVHKPDVREFGIDAMWVFISMNPPQPGCYEVSWYGSRGRSRRRRKHYAMAHARWNLTAEDDGVRDSVIGT